MRNFDDIRGMMARIGIDLRMTEATLKRGMGRYTLQQLHTVIHHTPDNQYVLFCLKQTPTSIQAFSQYANVTLDRRFVRYDMRLFAKHPHYADVLTQILDRIAWSHQLDVLHIPFWMNTIQPMPTKITTCPVIITVYDLIPMLFAEHFPQAPFLQALYDAGIRRMKSADHIIAISEATKRDVVGVLGYPEERVSIAYPAVDKEFRRLDEGTIQQQLTALWLRLRIDSPKHYIFSVSDHFYTKNLDTLLRAYAQLPADLRDDAPLVVTFDIYPHDRVRFMTQARELGIGEQVLFTGRVSEDELVALYNGALFTVYPSRYEGFGYPIAEAMMCGSAVISTTASSMPEVAGDVAILVDPEDADAMSQAMFDLYHTPEKRADMRQQGYIQARKFNLDTLREATIAIYNRVVTESKSRNEVSMPTRPVWYHRLRLAISCYVYQVKRWVYDKIYMPMKQRMGQ